MALAFLIEADTIKKRGFTNANVEVNIITTTLTRVQDIQLKSILGTSFFKRLLLGVENNDLNANEKALLNDYIHPFLIAQVDYEITYHLAFEIRSKTVGTTEDQYMKTADERNMLKIQDHLLGYADSYRNNLIGYLKDNCTLFSAYNDYICNFENVRPDKGQSQRTNIRFL